MRRNGPARTRSPLAIGVAAVAIAAAMPNAAQAQSSGSLLVAPVLPPDFASSEDQGVAERARPDWQALGVRLGAFTLKPRAGIAGGATSNGYLTRGDAESSAFVTSSAEFDLASGWSRHFVGLRGSGQLNRYIGNSTLNTTNWSLAASGRYDVHSTLQVAATADVTRDNESRFQGEAVTANFAVSPFIRETVALRANYRPGRAGLQLTANYRHLHFMAVRFPDGTSADQSIRDRGIYELIAEGTFARTPSFGLFVQAGVGKTRFDIPDPSLVVQGNSNGFRVLGGVNLALEGVVNGSIGIGWSRRNYADPRLSTRSGLSAEARVELLPEESTTVTVTARRQLSDANPTSGPFWETLVGAAVDHELRRNIIVGATGTYARQRYLDVGTRNSRSVSGGLSGVYLIARSLEARTTLIYRFSDTVGAARLNEFRGSAGLVFKL